MKTLKFKKMCTPVMDKTSPVLLEASLMAKEVMEAFREPTIDLISVLIGLCFSSIMSTYKGSQQ